MQPTGRFVVLIIPRSHLLQLAVQLRQDGLLTLNQRAPETVEALQKSWKLGPVAIFWR